MPQPSALEQPRVVRAFLQAQAQLPKLKTAALAPSQNETNAVLVPSQIESKIIHLKNRDADRGLEDYLSCKIDEIRLTASSLQDELLQQQQLVLETQTRAQRLEEVLQQRTFEYEQLLQQGADDIAQLKLDHDMQLQKASQAFAQQVEATQRSLQLKSESDRAILAESQRLENLRQRLEKDQQRLEEQQGKLQVLRRAVQIQESTAETALSSVVNEHANLHAQHLQLNADRNADTIRWQLQQVFESVIHDLSLFIIHAFLVFARPISTDILNFRNAKPKCCSESRQISTPRNDSLLNSNSKLKKRLTNCTILLMYFLPILPMLNLQFQKNCLDHCKIWSEDSATCKRNGLH